jgi:hypothetical protein
MTCGMQLSGLDSAKSKIVVATFASLSAACFVSNMRGCRTLVRRNARSMVADDADAVFL